MTYSEIEAFFEIIKAGSISAAAKNLFVTQPALSRRVKALEDELGYQLFVRSKGQRNIELTEKGELFISPARKWLSVWQESMEIGRVNSAGILNISSVGSVSSYILPVVFRKFSAAHRDVTISFHNYHSFESYRYVENGLIDIALISDDIYYKNVETIPAFKEPMVLAANISTKYPQKLSSRELDPEKEIRLPWNPEYDMWHEYWFQAAPRFRVALDQMSLLEYFLMEEDTWAMVPMSVAHKISGLSYVSVHKLTDGPPERIIYYLRNHSGKAELRNSFLEQLDSELQLIPGVLSFI